MERVLGRFAPQAYALLRIIAGLLFACHGAQKLFGAFGGVGGHTVSYMSQLGLAGVIEFFGGLMIATGFFASFAAIIASAEMAYAYVTVHAPRGLWPIQNGGELAVLYCFIFLSIACRGTVTWGIRR